MLEKNYLGKEVAQKENSVKKKNEPYKNKNRKFRKPVKVKPQIQKFNLNYADSISLSKHQGNW